MSFQEQVQKGFQEIGSTFKQVDEMFDEVHKELNGLKKGMKQKDEQIDELKKKISKTRKVQGMMILGTISIGAAMVSAFLKYRNP